MNFNSNVKRNHINKYLNTYLFHDSERGAVFCTPIFIMLICRQDSETFYALYKLDANALLL